MVKQPSYSTWSIPLLLGVVVPCPAGSVIKNWPIKLVVGKGLPGTHAVSVKREWKRLTINGRVETYEPPSLANLKAIAEGGNVPEATQYIRNWQSDFEESTYSKCSSWFIGRNCPLITDLRFTGYKSQFPPKPANSFYSLCSRCWILVIWAHGTMAKTSQ